MSWQSTVDQWIANNPNASSSDIAAAAAAQGGSYNPNTRSLSLQGQTYNPWSANQPVNTATAGGYGPQLPTPGTPQVVSQATSQITPTQQPNANSSWQSTVDQWIANNPNATPAQIQQAAMSQGGSYNPNTRSLSYQGQTYNPWSATAGQVVPNNDLSQPPVNTARPLGAAQYGLPGATGAQLGQNLYPAYWENLTSNVANYGSGLPSQIMDTYNNWYSGNLAAAPHANTLQGAQLAAGLGAPAELQQGSAALAGVNPFIKQAENALTRSAQYDPAELQRYLNPYTENAANAVTSMANRNLTENVLPQVNSTFTGQGQFGSSRNADFTNRAVRDNQEAVSKALASANYGAYDSAQKYYSDWANKAATSGQGLGQLGGQQINLGQVYGQLGSQMNATDLARLNALMSTGGAMQGLQQTEYDKVYNDWLTQQKYPAAMMGGLGSLVGSMAGGVSPDKLQTSAGSTAGMSDNARYATALELLGKGASDADIQKLLGGLFNWNT